MTPTPGARNLLKYMVKEDTEKKVATGVIRSVSAKELLAMTHQSVLARRRQVGIHVHFHGGIFMTVETKM